jgi:spermidine synthase
MPPSVWRYGSRCGRAMFSFAWWLALLIGFLSLSEEILWVRVAGFAYRTLPPAFSFVLMFYLLGIATGASFGKYLCGRVKNLYAAAAVLLAVAALLDALTPVVIANYVHPSDLAIAIPAVAIALMAASKSVLFPIVHHLGSLASGPRVGRSVSRIYFGNILGSTLGPLVTGFLALDYLTVDQCFGLAAVICLLASIATVLKAAKPQLILVTLVAAAAASAISSSITQPGPGSLGTLATTGGNPANHFVANRHGIVHTVPTAEGDMVYGGNVYDGMTSIDVDTNPNHLERLYMVALMMPSPKQVLFVGLSTGAWVRAIQGFPGVERIDVVEINPAYVDLIRSYGQLLPLLQDPRVHIHIDDGRRWLRRNPLTRFDLVVQNTTFYWRANAGNLLSREYFSEVKKHLDRGGVVICNTTGSFDVLASTQAVFGYAYRYSNFVYASEQPLTATLSGLWRVRRPDGALFTPDDKPAGSVAAFLASARLEPAREFIARRQADAQVITDDNLLSEYRDGARFGPTFLKALQPSTPAIFGPLDP